MRLNSGFLFKKIGNTSKANVGYNYVCNGTKVTNINDNNTVKDCISLRGLNYCNNDLFQKQDIFLLDRRTFLPDGRC